MKRFLRKIMMSLRSRRPAHVLTSEEWAGMYWVRLNPRPSRSGMANTVPSGGYTVSCTVDHQGAPCPWSNATHFSVTS